MPKVIAPKAILMWVAVMQALVAVPPSITLILVLISVNLPALPILGRDGSFDGVQLQLMAKKVNLLVLMA